jgi:hypothetical protein
MTYSSLIGFAGFYFSLFLLECLPSFSFTTSFHNVNNETCQEHFLISNSDENFHGLITWEENTLRIEIQRRTESLFT